MGVVRQSHLEEQMGKLLVLQKCKIFLICCGIIILVVKVHIVDSFKGISFTIFFQVNNVVHIFTADPIACFENCRATES